MKLRSVIKNKRGGYLDIFLLMIFAVIIVFVGAVMIYMGGRVQTELHDKLDSKQSNSEYVNYTTLIDENIGAVNTAYGALYWLSVFIIFGMILGIFIGSYMVQTKPVFFVPYIFIMIIAVVVSVGIANAYDSVRNDENLSATFDGYLGANFIMLHLPIWITIIGITGGIIMFVRMQRGEEYYEP